MQVEVDAVVIRAHQRSAFKAEQVVVEGEGLAVANLFLFVLDAVVTATQQGLLAFIPGVVFGVLPTTLGLEVIQLVVGAQVVVDLPFSVQARPLIVVMQFGITHVVVFVAQALVIPAIDQRYAEVILRLLVAIVVAEGERQVVAGLPAQGGADKGVFGVAVVDPAVALDVVDVQAVAQGVGQRAAAVQRLLARIVGAVAHPQVVFDGAGKGLFRDHVDHRASGAFAIQHRGRAAQYVDALHRPVVHRESHGACAAVHAHAVIELHHRTFANKAPSRVGRAAVARRAGVADAGGAGYGVLHAAVAPGADLRAGQAFNAGRGFEAVEVQA